jgi:hypothetical protein
MPVFPAAPLQLCYRRGSSSDLLDRLDAKKKADRKTGP